MPRSGIEWLEEAPSARHIADEDFARIGLNGIVCAVADTLEKRVADLEYLLTHLPEDLDARFAGVDVKLAGLRELILLQNGRFTKLEARLNEQVAKLETRFTELSRKVDGQGGQLGELSHKVDAQASQLTELSRKVDALSHTVDAQGVKLDEILARLPKPQL